MEDVSKTEGLCRNNCGNYSSDACYGLCQGCYKDAINDIEQKDASIDDLLSIDPEEIFDWEDSRLDEALLRLNIESGSSWSKSKKTYEVMNTIKERNDSPKEASNITSEKEALMLQVLNSQQLALVKMMEKVEGNSSTKSTKKAKKKKDNSQPEKIDRDIDYSSFIQWEKSWNLYTISENIEGMTDRQKTATFLGFFSKELLNDLENDYKINISPEQKVEDVIDNIKKHLRSQRPMLLNRYRLFTRNQRSGETLDSWYQELKRLADVAEIETMSRDELLAVIITSGIQDKNIRTKILKELKTPTFIDTQAFIEEASVSKEATGGESETKNETKQMNPGRSNQNAFQPRNSMSGSDFSSRNPKPLMSVNVKNQSRGVNPKTNVSGAHDRSFRQSRPQPLPMGRQNFDARRSNTNIPDASQYGSKGPERPRSDRGICYNCGGERHSSEGTKISWREKCPARNTICQDCKEIGHFKGMPGCRFKRRDNVIIIKQN